MLNRLISLLDETKTDGLIITSPHNLQYASGYTGGEGIILVTKTDALLLVDFRYITQAKNQVSDFTILMAKKALYKELPDILKNAGVKNLAFEDNDITCDKYFTLKATCEGINFVPAGAQIENLRLIKTPEEALKIKKAAQIADTAFKNLLPRLKVGMTEKEVAHQIYCELQKAGSDGTSFPIISVCGKNTALVHGEPSDEKIKYGDFLLMDYGAVYKGYCSDMTRTVVFGNATPRQKEIYEIVLNAQVSALNSIKPGVLCKEVDFCARNIIYSKGFSNNFGHSLGHGVGLKIHEAPTCSPVSDKILKENMVITCEPGIYIENEFGIRIEDLVMVTDNGICNFTSSPKNLITL